MDIIPIKKIHERNQFKRFSVDRKVQTTPYVIVENFLDEETLQQIDAIVATVNTHVVDSKYHDFDLVKYENIHLTDQVFGAYTQLIARKLLELNDQTFKTSITAMTEPRYSVYRIGDEIDWHVDQLPFPIVEGLTSEIVHRKLAATLMLSKKTEYEGGQFQTFVLGAPPNRCIDTIDLERGTLILFPAFVCHKVTPITSGVRTNIVLRLNGPAWQ